MSSPWTLPAAADLDDPSPDQEPLTYADIIFLCMEGAAFLALIAVLAFSAGYFFRVL